MAKKKEKVAVKKRRKYRRKAKEVAALIQPVDAQPSLSIENLTVNTAPPSPATADTLLTVAEGIRQSAATLNTVAQAAHNQAQSARDFVALLLGRPVNTQALVFALGDKKDEETK